MASSIPTNEFGLSAQAMQATIDRADRMYVEGRPSVENPTITVILGQPGSGKSTSSAAVRSDMRQNGGGEAVHVDMDELRNLHPRTEEIHARTGIQSSDHNWQMASRVTNHLLETGIQNRNNIVWETTGNKIDNIARVLTDARASGYRVDVVTVATQPEVSAAAVIQRYETGLETRGRGRNVPLGFHDDTVRVLPDNMVALAGRVQIDNTRVVTRDGQQLYPPAQTPGTMAGAAETVRDFHQTPLTQAQRAEIGNFFRTTTGRFEHTQPDIHRPADYRITVTARADLIIGPPTTPLSGELPPGRPYQISPDVTAMITPASASSTAPTADAPAPLPVDAPTPPVEVRPPAPVVSPVTAESLTVRRVSATPAPTEHHPPPAPVTTSPPAPPRTGGRFGAIRDAVRVSPQTSVRITSGVSVAGAGLGILGVEERIRSGQLSADLHGNRGQAVGGAAAFTADAVNATGGVTMAVARFMPTASEALTGASRLAGRVALPLAVASSVADASAGIASHDTGRVAGAAGRLGGGIVGGMLVGGGAGLVLGSETGPGALISGLVGAVAGGYLGETGARAAVAKTQDFFREHNPFAEFGSTKTHLAPHSSITVSAPHHGDQPGSRTLAPGAPAGRVPRPPTRAVIQHASVDPPAQTAAQTARTPARDKHTAPQH